MIPDQITSENVDYHHNFEIIQNHTKRHQTTQNYNNSDLSRPE